ncbi:FliG C-terminal domain-containing protein [Bacillus mexicanus]|uniref:flagellar motor switch protein FliG n=1 Tax=Bacillus mexicanus TaxID=2834415 RepID=UPI003D25A37B
MAKELTGPERAAILMGFVHEDTAKQIFVHLKDSDKREVLRAIGKLKVDDFDEVQTSIEEYLGVLRGNPNGLIESGVERVKKIMEGILSEDEQDHILQNIFTDEKNIFESLKNIKDVSPLVTLLVNEEPQLIALLASYMKPNMAAELFATLPKEKMRDVGECIALMGQTNPAVIAKWEEYLGKKIQNFSFSDVSPETNGVKNIVSILNGVTRATERVFFEALDEKNPELSKSIKDNMFVFEDISMLDSRSLQKVFSVITDNELIAKAIKTASIELKEKIMASFPKQRKDILDEELEGLGPIRREDSEEAQQKIANVVKELERNKEIVIDRGGGDVIF